MTPSSSDGSTNSSLTQEVTHQAERKKSDAAIAETYERDNEAASLRRREPWHRRLEQRLESRSPRVYRIFQFWRGPRPKVDLPAPSPFLDIDVVVKGHHIKLPIESSWTRITRPLRNPWLFALLVAAYIIGFALLTRQQWFLTPASSFIGCTATYWTANDGCGLNGDLCGPFDDGSTFDFRCPAQCADVILQNPRTIGNQQMTLVPLIVGGGDDNGTYRGDSFICSAATQAGLISHNKGGCASLQLLSNFTDFLPFSANGLNSVGFPTVFPIGFRFIGGANHNSQCEDIRDPVLAFNVIITCLLFLLLRPKPIILYWCLVCIGFWHVVLFSQPHGPPPALDTAFSTFLPTLFVAYAFWRLAFRFVLPVFLQKAPIEAMVWYLGPFWVTVLTNVTMGKIPINRLYAADLQRNGAITALVIIIVIVLILALNQVRVVRKTGWLPYYLGWYIIGGLILLVLSQLPGLELRLHHYIIGIILMPVSAFPTRLSAMYQGFLLGLFLNGVAAFGFDSILQTAEDLRQDAPLGSDLPTFLTNMTSFNASIPFINQTISWDVLPEGWDSFSLLVDDVERYAGTALNYSLAALEPSLPHFFRLALRSGDSTGDFTMPATLWPNGTWVDPLPGPS
ncbi:hypothetical protein PC9H_003517 [Pleurotus ostreatus]|uniref:LCCL domain-containing protein n=2 Tax=Pleurotus TaxID=5320 RepID=A0A8H7DU00_PLEOS|nr:uncharacterized protein PC9H_003517 [Pleurotus ostreatus]KAF7436684.1 hypothetical protein PC9H_003517 [Pleurotus ostreatus]KAG9222682.1 hypothetical protein CCMSSC00406_0004596 [Pleurotus cornucopiae]